MKTHELASALSALAQILRSGPDVELENFRNQLTRDKPPLDKEALAVNLATLAELSRVDRRQWQALVEENHFPIEIRPRDASRDILGKLLRYLEEQPSAREALRRTAKSTTRTSPELMRALTSLMEDA